MPLAIVTKSKMHQEMDKSNAKKEKKRQAKTYCSEARVYCSGQWSGSVGETAKLCKIKTKSKIVKKEPPQVGATSGQKLCTTIICMILQTAGRLF